MRYPVGHSRQESRVRRRSRACDASAAIGFADCVEGVGRMKHIDLQAQPIDGLELGRDVNL